MTEKITAAELTKAAHNLGRLADFVGVRRRWTLAEGGDSPADNAQKASVAMAEIICKMTAGEIATPVGVEQPSELEPAGEVSTDRLARFADYLMQLHRWFEAHNGAELPVGSEDEVRSIQRSLSATADALKLMLEEKALESEPKPEPRKKTLEEPEPLTRADLGPTIEVDTSARLILDHTWQKPLVQKRGGILELTPDTVKKLNAFFGDQGFELDRHEKRRLYERVQRWIESTPNERVLVLRMSGLFGKPDVVSSFQPKEDADKAPVAMPQEPVTVPQEPVAMPQGPVTVPQEPVAVPQGPVTVPQEPVAVPQAPVVVPEVIEELKGRSLLEEYMENPPSGVIPPTIAPPVMDDPAEKDPTDKNTKDDD